ncbi:MAG: ATP-dependent Clp protease adapter ClpS [Planctomycetota bacterium]|nr:MAG: ATP-dependent Clp protease adapter ClpS [Planctomycetota bacterium]
MAAPLTPAHAADLPGETRTLPAPQAEGSTRLDRPWKVVVWDDPINLMSYVAYVFQRLFGFSAEVANRKMREVHEEGSSVVATEARERAEFFVSRLHAYGLQATLEKVES